MQSIPDGVDLYVHRFIHESLTKELIKEYHSKYGVDYKHCFLYSKSLSRVYVNYRSLSMPSDGYNMICRCTHNFSGPIKHGSVLVCLPKRYYFSSGLSARVGYRNWKSV